MKCPNCGAQTDVVETRLFRGVFTRRTRKCFNGCKSFRTYEVFPGNLDRRTLEATLRGIRARAQARRRREVVARSPRASASALAKQLGISEARVREYRSQAWR